MFWITWHSVRAVRGLVWITWSITKLIVLKADMQIRRPGGGVFEAPFAKLAFLRPRACVLYGFLLALAELRVFSAI